MITGYSSDGGVYFPESIPRFDDATLEQMSNMSYKDIVKQIFKTFVSSGMRSVKNCFEFGEELWRILLYPPFYKPSND